MQRLAVVILAAGKGSRMLSKLPKVMLPLAGKPMLFHILESVNTITRNIFIVVGDNSESIISNFPEYNFVIQKQPLGTADAVKKVLPYLPDSIEALLILSGDTPLITAETIKKFLTNTAPQALGIMTITTKQPYGLGRIVRDIKGSISAIIEEKDASAVQKEINECNAGIYLIPNNGFYLLEKINNSNAQGEYYLPDLVALFNEENLPINSLSVAKEEAFGANNKAQLSMLEQIYQKRKADDLLAQGVFLQNPNTLICRGNIEVEPDVFIDSNVILEGNVVLKSGCVIGPFCHIKNSQIASGVIIKSHSVLDGVIVGNDCEIGPFARLRPDTELKNNVKIGNFVEIKHSILHENVKANHLAYLGNADIGQSSNIGAGVITCNYDGFNKHKAKIGSNAFIGSNVSLVSPIEIEDNSTIGAGSVITKNVPKDALALERNKQKVIQPWNRKKKIQEDKG